MPYLKTGSLNYTPFNSKVTAMISISPGSFLSHFNYTSYVAAGFSDGSVMVFGNDGTVFESIVAFYTFHDSISDISFSNSYLAAITIYGGISIWDINSCVCVSSYHLRLSANVYHITFHNHDFNCFWVWSASTRPILIHNGQILKRLPIDFLIDFKQYDETSFYKETFIAAITPTAHVYIKEGSSISTRTKLFSHKFTICATKGMVSFHQSIFSIHTRHLTVPFEHDFSPSIISDAKWEDINTIVLYSISGIFYVISIEGDGVVDKFSIRSITIDKPVFKWAFSGNSVWVTDSDNIFCKNEKLFKIKPERCAFPSLQDSDIIVEGFPDGTVNFKRGKQSLSYHTLSSPVISIVEFITSGVRKAKLVFAISQDGDIAFFHSHIFISLLNSSFPVRTISILDNEIVIVEYLDFGMSLFRSSDGERILDGYVSISNNAAVRIWPPEREMKLGPWDVNVNAIENHLGTTIFARSIKSEMWKYAGSEVSADISIQAAKSDIFIQPAESAFSIIYDKFLECDSSDKEAYLFLLRLYIPLLEKPVKKNDYISALTTKEPTIDEYKILLKNSEIPSVSEITNMRLLQLFDKFSLMAHESIFNIVIKAMSTFIQHSKEFEKILAETAMVHPINFAAAVIELLSKNDFNFQCHVISVLIKVATFDPSGVGAEVMTCLECVSNRQELCRTFEKEWSFYEKKGNSALIGKRSGFVSIVVNRTIMSNYQIFDEMIDMVSIGPTEQFGAVLSKNCMKVIRMVPAKGTSLIVETIDNIKQYEGGIIKWISPSQCIYE